MSESNVKTGGLITIRKATMSFLNERGEYSMKNYKRFAQLIIEGFSELNMYHLPGHEVAYLTPSSANIVNFPSDMTDWSAIGFNNCGHFEAYVNRKNMLFPVTELCGELQEQTMCTDLDTSDYCTYCFADHFNCGSYIPVLYGMRGGVADNYFKVDYTNRQIMFHSDVTGEIVLEYISTGISLTTTTYIPRQALEPLKAYVRWVITENDRRAAQSDKDRKEQLYHRALLRLERNYKNKFRIQDFLDAKYSTSKQTLKR